MRQIVVIGAGGYAREIIATSALSGSMVRAVYDDDSRLWGTTVSGVPVRGPVSQAEHAGLPAVLSASDPHTRRELANRLKLFWAVVVHPRATFDSFTSIKAGSIVLDGAVVQPGARIGAHVVVGPRSTLAHDCLVGDFADIGPGVQLAGFVEVGQCTRLETGAVVIPKVRIGCWCSIGPRSVVLRDLPDQSRVAGNPARPLPVQAPASMSIGDAAATLPLEQQRGAAH